MSFLTRKMVVKTIYGKHHHEKGVTPLHKKWSFPLRVSSVNVTKSAGNCGSVRFTEEIFNWKLHFFNAVDLICLLALFRTIKIARYLEEYLISQKVLAHLFKEKNIMSVIPIYWNKPMNFTNMIFTLRSLFSVNFAFIFCV